MSDEAAGSEKSALREKACERNGTHFLSNHRDIVIRLPEQPMAPTTTTEYQRAQRRLLLVQVFVGDEYPEVFARGAGIQALT